MGVSQAPIDVESVAESAAAATDILGFLHPLEQAELMVRPEPHRALAAMQVWCRKEAYLAKARATVCLVRWTSTTSAPATPHDTRRAR